MKRSIAFFDFDGTITTKDTLLEFIKFSKGSFAFVMGFLLYAPFLVAMKLKLVSNQAAKEKVLRHFFNGMKLADFEALCVQFAKQQMDGLIRENALRQIRTFQSKGIPVVVVSASAENWIRPWTDAVGLTLLGSRMEVADGRITGRLVGRNCYGDEKVQRIRERFDLSQFDEVFAYGDSSGDKAMLDLATHRFFKPFREKMDS